MKRHCFAISLAVGLFLMVQTAQGQVLLEDNFEAESPVVCYFDPNPTTNYTAFRNWNVVGGRVDLKNDSCFAFAVIPQGGSTRGKYVDMDFAPAVTLESKTTFTLNPGQYELRFDLAGDHLLVSPIFPSSLTASLGPVYTEGFSLPQFTPFQTITRNLQIPSPTSGKLIFRDSNTGLGPLLDNVKLTQTASTPPPVPAGPAVPVTGARVLPVTKKWNVPGSPTPLAPGGEAIAPGPEIASGQREASVTVSSGDPTGLVDVVLSAPKPGRKLTGGDCVRLAGKTAPYGDEDDEVGLTLEEVRIRAVVESIFTLIACLDLVKKLDTQAAAGATATVVGGAARASCRPSTVPLSLRVNRAARTITYRVRRASRRDPARRLRVSCRKARNGKVTMRIKTRSRRTKLRKVLGKRLVVGLYRPRAATGTANVRTTFKRR